MQKHDYFYNEGLKSGANVSLLHQFEWLISRKYLKITQAPDLEKYILAQIMPQESQESALQNYSYDQTYKLGKVKGEEIASFEALEFLFKNNILKDIPKNDQVKFLQVANSNLDLDSAISMIFDRILWGD